MDEIINGFFITIALFIIGALLIVLAKVIGLKFIFGVVIFVVIWYFLVQVLRGSIE